MTCYDPLLEFEKQCELKNKNTSQKQEYINLDQYCTLNSNADFCQDEPDLIKIEAEIDKKIAHMNAEKNISPIFGSKEKKIKKSFDFSGLLWHWGKLVTVYFILSGTIFGVLMSVMNFSAYSARLTHWIQPEKIENIQESMQRALIKNTPRAYAGEIEQEEEIKREVVEEKILIQDPDMVFDRSYNEKNLLSGLKTTSASKANFSLVPRENRIIIPRIGKNIPLLDVDMKPGVRFDTMNKIFMKELKNGIVRYPGTAKPGQKGNAFIFGHSSNYPWVKSKYNEVFALLDKMKNGDKIIAYYDGKKYVYKVTDRATVKPGNTSVLQSRNQNKKEISLMTCWPVGTTLERLIIFGELVEES